MTAIPMICKQLYLGFALSGLLLISQRSVLQAQEDSANESRITQHVTIRCERQGVYEALTSSVHFERFSGYAGIVSAEEGDAFSLFDNQITGRNLVLVPNHLIVQAWRVETWPEGHFSIARFALSSSGDSTRIDFDHWGYPADTSDHLAAGWTSMYWNPLRAYCETSDP